MMRLLEVHKLQVKYVPDVLVKMRLGGTTNKSWRNVWVQNQEVVRALQSHGLSPNLCIFLCISCGHVACSSYADMNERPCDWRIGLYWPSALFYFIWRRASNSSAIRLRFSAAS